VFVSPERRAGLLGLVTAFGGVSNPSEKKIQPLELDYSVSG